MGEYKEDLIRLEGLPIVAKERDNQVYDSRDPEVQRWLREHWIFGYNPLAASKNKDATAIRIYPLDGRTYDYQDPTHAFGYYQQNLDENLPNFLVHNTQSGWVEYAIRENDGFIGKEKEIWTASSDPQRWWGGKFPDDYKFQQPSTRFVELVFDAGILKQEGFIPRKAPRSDYFVFDKRLPLKALVPTSKAYLSQVMNLNIP